MPCQHKKAKNITYSSRLNVLNCNKRYKCYIQPSSLRATPIKTPLLAATIYPFVLSFHLFLLSSLSCLSSTITPALQSGSAAVMLSDRRCMNILAEIQIVRTEIYYYNKIIRAHRRPRDNVFSERHILFLLAISPPSELRRNVNAKERKP